MIKKDRFSISMDIPLVKLLDAEVEKGRYASRSHAVEFCVKQNFQLDEFEERITKYFIELVAVGAKNPELLEVYKKALNEWLKIKR
ncbi:Transcriptional regulator, contains Arc/MetJ-type RHH (ribbon-helix-helix) DNA-binding domain [Methanophagales archaeon]|nr:Transcriptional regulator, contains Arc/MetJ-type RHH (ribbon-helix-helix) DNA-binding domain [Methanophagales archaeon]